MELMGYAVELDTCVKCNDIIEGADFFFCAESGGIVCNKCKDHTNNLLNFTTEMRNSLKEIVSVENSTVEITLSCCFNILKNYISHRSPKKIKTADLIECLC